MNNRELFLIALENKELSGNQIWQAVHKTSLYTVVLKSLILYPTLDKLEKNGLVTSRWGVARLHIRGGVRRRYYKLTEDGIKALNQQSKNYSNVVHS